MKLKQLTIGTLLYLGLFALVIFSISIYGMFLFSPISIPFLLAIIATAILCGAFLFQTLEKATTSHLLIAILSLYFVCVTLLRYTGNLRRASEFFFLAGVIAILGLIAEMGVLFAKWAQRKWPSAKARRVRIWAAPALVLATCLGFYLYDLGSVALSGIQAANLTTPDLRCDASELQTTKVVPELQAPVTTGTNLIWCAPFQLAWNGMTEQIGEEIHLAGNEPSFVTCLNQHSVGEEHLDSETYIAVAAPYTQDFIAQMNSAIKSKFGSGTFAPEALPKTDGQERLAAFGYLSVNLPFEHAFQRTENPLNFGGVRVKAFTLPFGMGSEIRAERAHRQVRVCYPPEEKAFIVELLTKKSDHHLILAQVSPEATLAETVDKVNRYANTLPRESLSPNQDLKVPLFNFDITREYTELTGNSLLVENPAYRNWQIERAGQTIRFQLDERGAVLKSNAFMVCVKCAPPIDCIFDKPFLLMLRYGNSPQPYFAMWVDNAEILVKSVTTQN